MVKIRLAQRGLTLFVQAGKYRGRIGTWTYGSVFPGNLIDAANPRERAFCAWLEIDGRCYGKVR